jgi:hypothetical protein
MNQFWEHCLGRKASKFKKIQMRMKGAEQSARDSTNARRFFLILAAPPCKEKNNVSCVRLNPKPKRRII